MQRFIENGDNTITDTKTNLIWTKNTVANVDFDDAEKAVAELGDGWRLPTRQELESILDLSRHDPAIDTDKFPDTKRNYYWTSTPCAWRASGVWVVPFGSGSVLGYDRYDYGCVRAVRSGR